MCKYLVQIKHLDIFGYIHDVGEFLFFFFWIQNLDVSLVTAAKQNPKASDFVSLHRRQHLGWTTQGLWLFAERWRLMDACNFEASDWSSKGAFSQYQIRYD